MKRLFIGIPMVSEKTVKATESWRQNELLKHHVLKWVNPENWHITLIFLGSTPEASLGLLQQLIEESFVEIPAFSSELNSLGVFPNTHNPKVLWLGIENIQCLMQAISRMIELLQQNGFSIEDKPLKPHLTLARVKNMQHRTSFESLRDKYHSSSFGKVAINRIVLYESISTGTGPIYKPLFVKELS